MGLRNFRRKLNALDLKDVVVLVLIFMLGVPLAAVFLTVLVLVLKHGGR